MRRRLLTIAATISLLLCIGSVLGWLRSRWVGDNIGLTWHGQDNGKSTSIDVGFVHGGGDVGFFIVKATPSMSARRWVYVRGPTQPLRQLLGQSVVGVLGYGWYSDWFVVPATAASWTMRGVVLPYWLVIVISAIVPTWWWLNRWSRRAASRLARGLCPTCGYDLRATPERCPECGTAPKPAPRNAATLIA